MDWTHQEYCEQHLSNYDTKITKELKIDVLQEDIPLQQTLYNSYKCHYLQKSEIPCKEKEAIIKLISDLEIKEGYKSNLEMDIIMEHLDDDEYENECYKMTENSKLLMKLLRKHRRDNEWIANLLTVLYKSIMLKKLQVVESFWSLKPNPTKITSKIIKYQFLLLELLQ